MKVIRTIFIGILIPVIALVLSQVFFVIKALKSPQWEYAQRALACTTPNYDLRYCIDLDAGSRKDFTHNSWKPMPCINTATSFYNPKRRAGNCNRFKANPTRWGFKEVSAKESVPGDLILWVRKKDGARHAAVYTCNSIVGPLCANSSYPRGAFYHFTPVNIIKWLGLGGFREMKYYRYTK